jgi:hypothetical protein
MRYDQALDNKIISLRNSGIFALEISKILGLTLSQVNGRLTLFKLQKEEDFFTDVVCPCPKCGKERVFKNKLCKNIAQKSERACRSCFAEGLKASMKGDKNPFYGKKHTDEYKKNASELRKGTKLSDERREESIFYLNKYLKDNPRKSPYQHWLSKFGKEVADQKMEELRKKYSIATSGENNPMYGKPTPKKAGNGWSGWYKDFYFRSLRELQFFVSHEESGELKDIHLSKEYRIPYVGVDGQNRTYSPDFILNNNEIIEIKPKKLWNTRENKLKFEAMSNFCERNGLLFSIIDVIPDSLILKEKYLNGEIKFDKKCDDKFKKYCGIE